MEQSVFCLKVSVQPGCISCFWPGRAIFSWNFKNSFFIIGLFRLSDEVFDVLCQGSRRHQETVSELRTRVAPSVSTSLVSRSSTFTFSDVWIVEVGECSQWKEIEKHIHYLSRSKSFWISILLFLYKVFIGAGEVAQHLRALAAFPRSQVWYPAPTWQLTVTKLQSPGV